MVDYKMFLRCDEFCESEAMIAIIGLAKANKCSVEDVTTAYAIGNNSVVKAVDDHVLKAAKDCANVFNEKTLTGK